MLSLPESGAGTGQPVSPRVGRTPTCPPTHCLLDTGSIKRNNNSSYLLTVMDVSPQMKPPFLQ